MWPFTSSKPTEGKKTEDINKELPKDLQEFFKQENPDKKHANLFEQSSPQNHIFEVLNKHKDDPKDPRLAYYKSSQDINNACAVNCSEIKNQVVECSKQVTWLQSGSPCADIIKAMSACTQIQKTALQTLHFDECYNVKQCQMMRYYVDKIFTENFGQYGSEMNDETRAKFNKDIDDAVYKVWI
ncbi:uncharacterized protein SPAPADRAFT_141336 [Spathaspora passalidarum NRRL Y-27907]|uniref:Uncharacterized protein n=1 Tax=Spathaspora passalidarum (strain NRRL Y-27907 / 11-Y1) TaxID=619300 RepID=G3ARL1_SPAPN|nr:uncharacterized protein SPAPADRAFT_141336 [Spathaspora passalidarum NRRL Y-27907]EGW31764.1 hypothetical protein SPAPADRAFT_141336 [Spathaspora passalidarum NRRL Y-27907]